MGSWFSRLAGLKQINREDPPDASSGSENESADGKLKRRVPPTFLAVYKRTELATATNNFSDGCLLGEGGFGPIYKGRLWSRFGPTYTEEVVAIRRLHPDPQSLSQFYKEVAMLSRLDSLNFVNLIGYCIDEGRGFLVYKYMLHGSLDAHLFGPTSVMRPLGPLDWKTRMQIALHVANGLYHLHIDRNPPVIHGNLKCSNILLDEEYHAKLMDFGSTERKHGFYGRMTVESDIYAFGVVLLEIITGRRVLDSSKGVKERNLVAWAQSSLKDQEAATKIADKSLGYFSAYGFHKAAFLASLCLEEDPSKRPRADEIVDLLTHIVDRS